MLVRRPKAGNGRTDRNTASRRGFANDMSTWLETIMRQIQHQGGCLCGAVRITVHGEPYRVGICHRLDCRKHHRAIFHTFAVFPVAAVQVAGITRDYRSRNFCPSCGSSLFGRNGDEIEVHVGCLDAPNQVRPTYENWIIRREEWLPPFDVARRYRQDREGTGRTEP
jgi:hypothetical protein